MKYTLLALFIVLALPLMAHATAVNGQAVSLDGEPLSNAIITVCSGWSNIITSNTTQLCTAQLPLATIYANGALTNTKGDPLNADENGRYGFFVVPGKYTISIEKAGYLTHSEEIDETCGPEVSGNISCGFANYTWDSTGNIVGAAGLASGSAFSIKDSAGNVVAKFYLDGQDYEQVPYLYSTYGIENGNGSGIQVAGAGGNDGAQWIVTGGNLFEIQYFDTSNAAHNIMSLPVATSNPTLTISPPTVFSGTVNGINWSSGSGAPSGSCTSPAIYMNTAGTSGSAMFDCVAGAWKDVN